MKIFLIAYLAAGAGAQNTMHMQSSTELIYIQVKKEKLEIKKEKPEPKQVFKTYDSKSE